MSLYQKRLSYIAFTQALVAMVVSLYFSDILKLSPCTLCWYQRIALYPLVAIMIVGIIIKDKNLPLYVLPLSITGLVIAFYHSLLNYNVIAENIISCDIGISCATKQIQWLGFITIPLLSFIAFAIIIVCMLASLKRKQS